MKTLIISGSPRENGDSMVLINEMKKYLKGEVVIVDTYKDNISPCIDCRYCWENDGCVIDDEMQNVYELLNEVDNVVLSSPLYFSELTGKMLSFASRFQCFYVTRCIKKDGSFKLKNKNAVLILTGGGDGSPKPAIERANVIFKHINAQPIGTVLSLQTNSIPAKEDAEALQKAQEFSLKLNELYESKQVNKGFSSCLQIFPVPDINKTADYYKKLGFRSVYYLDSAEPHVCLYRDSIEIVLTQSKNDSIIPNRQCHGYGYDAYFITDVQKEIETEFTDLDVKIVRPLSITDYSNKEFVFEDIDGRWIAVGKKG